MKRRQPASPVRLKAESVWRRLNRLTMTQNELARLRSPEEAVARRNSDSGEALAEKEEQI